MYPFVRDDHDYVSPAATRIVVLDTAAPSTAFDLKPYTRGKRIAGAAVGLSGGITPGAQPARFTHGVHYRV